MLKFRYFFPLLLLIGTLSCSKKEETTSTTTAKTTIDTSEKAEPVAITDTSHHLFYRPKAGSVRRYHVIDHMSATATDAQPNGQSSKRSATSENEFYVTQSTGATAADSTVEVTFRIDSMRVSSDQDTTKMRYSSNDPKDRADAKYQQFNVLIGKSAKLKVNKFGDLMDMTDVSQISDALLSSVPDSLKSNPKIKAYAKEKAQEIVNAYLMRVLVHSPTRALVKDTTWKNTSDVNLDVAQGLTFPVTVDATESVRGLEKRGSRVLAVLEDNTTTTPKKKLFEEGPTKATVSNFVASSHSVVRIDDATGILYHRALEEKRSFTFTIENTQHPGEKRTISQNGSETLTAELLSESGQ
jgi:hypothetical protein